MKFLIVGLGNIGAEYQGTRHNIGFTVLDALASASNAVFSSERFGAVAQTRIKNAQLVLLKPSTYMNLSGEAVRYWKQKENIAIENILVIVDDIALPFGAIRMRSKGADGGLNGLKSIEEYIGTQKYDRLKFGISHDFQEGGQFDYVLSPFTENEVAQLPYLIERVSDGIKNHYVMEPNKDKVMNVINNG